MNVTTNIVLPPEADYATAIKKVTQTADITYLRVDYSCGLIIEAEIRGDKVDFRCNWKIVQLPDGRYAIEKP